MLERQLVFPDEIVQGKMHHAPVAVARVLQAGNVATALANGSPTRRPESGPARFAIGQAVRMHHGKVEHHTRLPSYVRGKLGTIERIHGAHVFADANAQGLGEQPQWLYNVVFDEGELWNDRPAERQNLSVSVDAWESYLEAAE